MRKPKVKQIEPVETGAEAPGDGSVRPKKKPLALLLAGVGALLFFGSGAGVFFLAPSEAQTGAGDKSSVNGTHSAGKPLLNEADQDGPHGGGNAAAPPLLGQFTLAGATAFYLPDPFVVSLDPRAGARHLKVALAIEAPPETAALYQEKALRLRDAMTTYLRAVDIAVIADPARMSSLREQLKRRIAFVVSPENVTDVLILDFILT
ncbi:MAG: flagellar basal body-associated FliL family protein [Parvularculaceae bacterium]